MRHGEIPGAHLPGWRRAIRRGLSRVASVVLVRSYVRLRIEGRAGAPPGPALYCFNHLNWVDPFVVVAALPGRPPLYFFGPSEEDMGKGGKNRLMAWSGRPVPFKPGRRGLIEAVRTVGAVFESGGSLAIAGEGRIHVREADLLPLDEGPAFLALRAGVPLVPLAINGTSWLRFRGRVRVRIGRPVELGDLDPSDRAAVPTATARLSAALGDLVADHPELPPSRGLGAWLTERFNAWPEGSRAAADAAREAARAPSGPAPAADGVSGAGAG